MTTPTYTPEQLREYAADIERHQNTVAVEGCDPAWMVARLRELAAAQSELAAIKAAVESSGDELVLELQAGMVRNGRGGPNTLQRAAAHILALRVELASVKAERDALKERIWQIRVELGALFTMLPNEVPGLAMEVCERDADRQCLFRAFELAAHKEGA